MYDLYFLTESNKKYLSELSPLKRIELLYNEYSDHVRKKKGYSEYFKRHYADLELYIDFLVEEKKRILKARDTIKAISEVPNDTMLREIYDSITLINNRIEAVYSTYIHFKNFQTNISFDYGMPEWLEELLADSSIDEDSL